MEQTRSVDSLSGLDQLDGERNRGRDGLGHRGLSRRGVHAVAGGRRPPLQSSRGLPRLGQPGVTGTASPNRPAASAHRA